MPRELGRASVSDPISLDKQNGGVHRAQKAAEVTPSYRQ